MFVDGEADDVCVSATMGAQKSIQVAFVLFVPAHRVLLPIDARLQLAETNSMSGIKPLQVKSCIGGFSFLAWAITSTVLISMLMATHEIPLPEMPINTAARLDKITMNRWRMIHVLATGCPCSATVADYLCKRGPLNDVDEWVSIDGVLAVDQTDVLQSRLRAVGFGTSPPLPDQMFIQSQVTGSPWLLVINSQGHIVYSGGYAATRPGPGVAMQDVSILNHLQRGDVVKRLPVYGCATSIKVQSALDPFGLKY